MLSHHEAICLTLAPLVEVARADGEVDQSERRAVLDSARTWGLPRWSRKLDWLEAWLEWGVPEDVHSRWRDQMRDLKRRLSAERWIRIRTSLLQCAFDVAEATGGSVGPTATVSVEERRQIARLRDCLDAI